MRGGKGSKAGTGAPPAASGGGWRWCASAGVVPVWAAGHPGLWPLHGAGGPAGGCSQRYFLPDPACGAWWAAMVSAAGGGWRRRAALYARSCGWARTVGMIPETVCWAGCGEDGFGELRAKA